MTQYHSPCFLSSASSLPHLSLVWPPLSTRLIPALCHCPPDVSRHHAHLSHTADFRIEIWCNSQISQCPLICTQYPGNSPATDANSCDPTELSYSCVCSNGQTPNITEYSQTLPYFVCSEWGNQCVAGCGQDNSCSNACRANHPCGASDPKLYTSSSASMSMSSTSGSAASAASSTGASTGASNTAVYTGFAGAAATTTAASAQSGSSTGAATALRIGESYGLIIVAAGVLGGFAVLL